jgi:purine-binding chemotaxis protein CheW
MEAGDMIVEQKEVEGGVSLCTLRTGDDVFGIETAVVREALYQCEVRAVPLAPKFVAGVLAYRGEVLLALSFRAMLGLAPKSAPFSAIVMQDSETGEPFALLIDELLDVVQAGKDAWEPNPATLDERRQLLFAGAYRRDGAPLIRLESEQLQPSSLMRSMDRDLRNGERA